MHILFVFTFLVLFSHAALKSYISYCFSHFIRFCIVNSCSYTLSALTFYFLFHFCHHFASIWSPNSLTITIPFCVLVPISNSQCYFYSNYRFMSVFPYSFDTSYGFRSPVSCSPPALCFVLCWSCIWDHKSYHCKMGEN